MDREQLERIKPVQIRMSPAEAARIVHERRMIRENLSFFIRKSFESVDPSATYAHNWHIDCIAEYLMACYRREIKRLVINIQPRSIKSIACTISFPAFLMGHNPSEKIMAASYSGGLSMKHAMDQRYVMAQGWYQGAFPELRFIKEQSAKSKFMTTDTTGNARGHRIATSVGGTATGEGGNFIIIDDPLNPKQAVSDAERDRANTWFDQTISNRLDDKENGVIIIVMQRLHINDVAGHVLDSGEFEHLRIPTVAEERTTYSIGNFSYTREKGELLHEEREGPDAIERQKIRYGAYGFAGQYQQRPVPMGGGFIKLAWFPRYKTKTVPRQVILSVDSSYKGSAQNDPTCIQVWAERDDKRWELWDVWTERVGYPVLKRTLVSVFEKWREKQQCDGVIIEDKASGQSLIQELHEEHPHIPVIAAHPGQLDKPTRMQVETTHCEAGQVVLPETASWLPDLETDLMHFPKPPVWDRIDAMSQFLKWAFDDSRDVEMW